MADAKRCSHHVAVRYCKESCNLKAGEVSLQGQESRFPTNARNTRVAHRYPVLCRRSDMTMASLLVITIVAGLGIVVLLIKWNK